MQGVESGGDAAKGRRDASGIESAPCARIEREIASANDRLRSAAQNLSLEWKSFLSFAMEMKGSVASPTNGAGGDSGESPEQSEVENLLMHSRSGLVILREMQTRRERKWHDIRARYAYEHPSLATADSSPVQNDGASHRSPNHSTTRETPPSQQRLLERLVGINREVADAARVALATQELDTSFTAESPLSISLLLDAISSESQPKRLLRDDIGAQYTLAKVRTHALAVVNRLERGERHSSGEEYRSPLQGAAVEPDDVEELLEVTFERRQLRMALDRLFTRMRWLCVSHRFHLRRRMLSIDYQHRLESESKATGTSSDGHKCPLLIAQIKQTVEAEVDALLQMEHALSIPRGKRSEVDSISLRQTVDDLLRRGLEETAFNCQISTEVASIDKVHDSESGTEFDREKLAPVVLEHATCSRWDLLQAPYYLATVTGGVQQPARTGGRFAASVDTGHGVDAILQNEWKLLQLDDATYVRTRLETLASTHEQRGTITINMSERNMPATAALNAASVQHNVPSSARAIKSPVKDAACRPKTASSAAADSTKVMLPAAASVMSDFSATIYALYALRVLSCRSQRRQLLRVLNYAHYLQRLARRSSAGEEGAGSAESKQQPRERDSAPLFDRSWKISLNSAGERIVSQEMPRRNEDTAEASVGREAISARQTTEVIFDEARHDLSVLEHQMLRIASHFIRKQEQDCFQGCCDTTDSFRECTAPTIDRLQVLRDLFECQIAYQKAKVQLVELLLANGLLGHTGGGEANREEHLPGLQLVTLVLQRRPLVDFSHAYFTESFASETVQLELQIRLQQQIRDHLFSTFQSLQAASSGVNPTNTDERERRTRLALARRSESGRCVAQFWLLQEQLLDEAESKWFIATSISERHALRQSIYEQVLVTWQLITKLEIPTVPVHVLERSAGDILTGTGLQSVLPPPLLIDASRQLYAKARAQAATAAGTDLPPVTGCPLVEWLVAAWHLLEWHQHLAIEVYAADLLERVCHFQYSFSREVDHANEQARLFYFDALSSGGGCDAVSVGDRGASPSMLEPIGIQLELADSGVSDAQSLRIDGVHETVPNWIEHHLWSVVMKAEQYRREEGWSDAIEYPLCITLGCAALLRLQQQWVECLGVQVRYQDRVGTHVFEFASSSSFIAVKAMREQRQQPSQPGAAFSDIDIDLIRVKYAGDVAHRITEEMQQRCYPYWTSLETLKQRLRSLYSPSSATVNVIAGANRSGSISIPTLISPQKTKELKRVEHLEHFGPVIRVESATACCRFLSDSVLEPNLLLQLDALLQRLRNEAQTALWFGGKAHELCAFRIPTKSEGDDSELDALSKWFISKFDQLKKDLQTHGKESSGTGTAVNEAIKTTGTHNRSSVDAKDDDEDDENHEPCELLLRSLPSFSLLLRRFSSSCRAKEAKAVSSNQCVPVSLSDAAEQHSSEQQRRQEANTTALKELIVIYGALAQMTELCRVECALLDGIDQQSRTLSQCCTEWNTHPDNVERNRHRLIGGSSHGFPAGNPSDRNLLSQWQCRLHSCIRRHLRAAASRVNAQQYFTSADHNNEAALRRSLHPTALFPCPALLKDVHEQHRSAMLRHEVVSAVQCHLKEQRELILFALAAATMQTFSDGNEGQTRRSHLLELDAIVTTFDAIFPDERQNTITSNICNSTAGNNRLLAVIGQLKKALDRLPLLGVSGQTPERRTHRLVELRRLYEAVSSTDTHPRESTAHGEPLRQDCSVPGLIKLLRLQRVFVEERMSLSALAGSVPTRPASPTQSSPNTRTVALDLALRSLEAAWTRYHETELARRNGESVRDDIFDDLTQQPIAKNQGVHLDTQSAPGLVSGNNFRLKMRLFGDRQPRYGEEQTWDGNRWLALECLTLGQQTHTQIASSAMLTAVDSKLLLPSDSRIREYVKWLHGALELEWIHRDMNDMQAHYDSLLRYRKQRHEQRSRTKSISRHSPAAPLPQSPSLSVLRLANFFSESVVAASLCESNSSDASSLPGDAAKTRVPYQEIVDAYEHSLMLAFSRCEELDRELRHLRGRLLEAETDAEVKREVHAVDYAYALHFKMQALNDRLDLAHRRAESELAAMRCEVGSEYADKLQSLRVQLLAAGSQFDDFRTQLQSELTEQLQLAQTRAIEQLVDGGEHSAVSATMSASLSVQAKAELLTSLPPKQQQLQQQNQRQIWRNGGAAESIASTRADTVARLERESAALKRSILRLKALVAVQQQVQAGARDREVEMTRRHAANDVLRHHEIEQLQAHVSQLETEVSRLAQENARVQQHAARLEQERDHAIQRRREAKARALSATYSRRVTEEGGSNNDYDVDRRRLTSASTVASTTGRRASSARVGGEVDRDVIPDWEKMQEDFEMMHERAIRSGDSRGPAVDDEEAAICLANRYQRSMRHQQNEIKRLQQQLARESKLKAEALRQLADMKAVLDTVRQQDRDIPEVGSEGGNLSDVAQNAGTATSPNVSVSLQQHQARSAIPPSPRRAQSAAPCAPMRHRVLAPGAGAPLLGTPSRPATSFSPRVSSAPPSLLSPPQSRPTESVVDTVSQGLARRPLSRGKFHVVKPERSSLVGGVAGVPSAMSVREPLPYR